jgi:hypothetical protein
MNLGKDRVTTLEAFRGVFVPSLLAVQDVTSGTLVRMSAVHLTWRVAFRNLRTFDF